MKGFTFALVFSILVAMVISASTHHREVRQSPADGASAAAGAAQAGASGASEAAKAGADAASGAFNDGVQQGADAASNAPGGR